MSLEHLHSDTDVAAQRAISSALVELETVILGKSHQLRLALACLLARGHLLIEDLPGMGKTTLAQALARVLGDGEVVHQPAVTLALGGFDAPLDLASDLVLQRILGDRDD